MPLHSTPGGDERWTFVHTRVRVNFLPLLLFLVRAVVGIAASQPTSQSDTGPDIPFLEPFSLQFRDFSIVKAKERK